MIFIMQTPSHLLDRKTLLAIVEASSAILDQIELAQVLSQIAEQAAGVLGAEGASVLLLDSSGRELVFHAATGPKGDELRGTRFDSTLGIAGQAVKTRRALRVDDVHSNRNFFPGIDAKTQLRTQTIIAAPLIHHDEVIGVVEVFNPSKSDSAGERDRELELVKVFANLAAAAARNAKAYDQVSKQNVALKQSQPVTMMIGKSAAISQVLELCNKVAKTDATVLLQGETGSGKEVAARMIHELSGRKDQPFVAINCAAVAQTLFESELFGHEKGAFTDAREQRLGRFELADGGTLFLDEISEVSLESQVKLLRVLQERQFERVGGTKTVSCDVRIIAATNRDLKQEMQAGRFREDLYYRLEVFPIMLPPLRERTEDIALLVEHFSQVVAPSLGHATPRPSEEAMGCLLRYGWPGNVRELRNIVERCALLATGMVVEVGDLPGEISGVGAGGGDKATSALGDSALARQEKALLVEALNHENWNQSAAARRLGISRDNLRYRVKKYGLVRG